MLRGRELPLSPRSQQHLHSAMATTQKPSSSSRNKLQGFAATERRTKAVLGESAAASLRHRAAPTLQRTANVVAARVAKSGTAASTVGRVTTTRVASSGTGTARAAVGAPKGSWIQTESPPSFDPAARTNEKLFKNHVNAVIARLLRRKLLIRVNDSVRLFEISMVLRLIFNAEEVASLKAAFKAKRLGETDPDEMPQDDDETEDETA